MLSFILLLTLVGGSLQGGFLLNNFAQSVSDLANVKSQVPQFCHDLDCPTYTLLENNTAFEVRRYDASQWVATKLVTMLYTKQDSDKMFFKLFHYIAGNNSNHIKIPMTAPVVTEVIHGQGPDCESNFTMHFFMPFNLQAKPPQPTEDGVFIRNLPAMTVFVKSYGGFSTDDVKRMKLEELINDLNAANKKYRDDVFLTAGYDGPYAIDRHNEIWAVAV